jgi:LysR family hydrogen peroxide-inducible transcriptional activator
VNLRDLRYLVAIAQHRHFGRAAEACFVSQPTLSTQIKKLEETLGVTLIERTHRQVMLTPVGRAIVAQAERVLREVDQLTRIAEQHRDPFGGNLKLGIIPTVAPYLLPRILPAVRRRFPALEIQLSEAQTASIVRMLKDGSLDAAILALPITDEHLKQVKLYAEPFYFAASKHHPKARKSHVTLDDLEDERVLLLEDGHCLRDQALEICNTHNAVENTNFRATSIETLRQMVAADAGITLMPELAVPPKSGRVAYIPFRGKAPARDVGLIWRESSPREPLLKELVDVLKGVVKGG